MNAPTPLEKKVREIAKEAELNKVVGQDLIDNCHSWLDDLDPKTESTWRKINKACCFKHTDDDACEFIIHIGQEFLENENCLDLPAHVKEICEQAIHDGYKYICFYC